MHHVKIKTEKPDVEGSGARSRLDAVLQGLVEKSDSEREQNEDETKIAEESLSKDVSPSSAGKRPLSRFPQHRRKKRKEMDDSLTVLATNINKMPTLSSCLTAVWTWHSTPPVPHFTPFAGPG
ncbi:hypothetical protein J4Q44_G00022360 [Coregonus suidteri]|uniref:Uncharacterized protein n=1 Tax=Coregonus suidteri TaxID=861788 RepID=A0AAN8MH01_9TELE